MENNKSTGLESPNEDSEKMETSFGPDFERINWTENEKKEVESRLRESHEAKKLLAEMKKNPTDLKSDPTVESRLSNILQVSFIFAGKDGVVAKTEYVSLTFDFVPNFKDLDQQTEKAIMVALRKRYGSSENILISSVVPVAAALRSILNIESNISYDVTVINPLVAGYKKEESGDINQLINSFSYKVPPELDILAERFRKLAYGISANEKNNIERELLEKIRKAQDELKENIVKDFEAQKTILENS